MGFGDMLGTVVTGIIPGAGIIGGLTKAVTGVDPIKLGVKTAVENPALAKKAAGKAARFGLKSAELAGQRVIDSSVDIAAMSGKIAGAMTTGAGMLASTGIGAPLGAAMLAGAGVAGGVSAAAGGVSALKDAEIGLHQSTGAERAKLRKEQMATLRR